MPSAASWSEEAAPRGSQGLCLGAIWVRGYQQCCSCPRVIKAEIISSQIRCFWGCGSCQQGGADCANLRASPEHHQSSRLAPIPFREQFFYFFFPQEDANSDRDGQWKSASGRHFVLSWRLGGICCVLGFQNTANAGYLSLQMRVSILSGFQVNRAHFHLQTCEEAA